MLLKSYETIPSEVHVQWVSREAPATEIDIVAEAEVSDPLAPPMLHDSTPSEVE
jgi:hypothetical protein